MFDKPELYSGRHTIDLLGRMGIDREAALDVYQRCHGRATLDRIQKVLQEDKNTQALSVHAMAAAIAAEDAVDRGRYPDLEI
jgi:hypothetical protein